jgi:Family of unknown function (DUF6188)
VVNVNLDVSDQSIMRVYFDYAITFVTSGGGEFRAENTVTVSMPGGSSSDIEPGSAGPGAEVILSLLHQKLRAASADERGCLELTFASGAKVRVESDAQYEAWTYAGPDGVKVVSMPGGELATWGLIE